MKIKEHTTMKRNLLGHFAIAGVMGFGLAAAAQAIEAGKLDIHGFLAQGFLWSDRQNYPIGGTRGGTTQFNEIGINFTAEPADRLRLGTQLFARDFSDNSDVAITLDWAVADYRWRDWAGIRAGRLKRANGLYN